MCKGVGSYGFRKLHYCGHFLELRALHHLSIFINFYQFLSISDWSGAIRARNVESWTIFFKIKVSESGLHFLIPGKASIPSVFWDAYRSFWLYLAGYWRCLSLDLWPSMLRLIYSYLFSHYLSIMSDSLSIGWSEPPFPKTSPAFSSSSLFLSFFLNFQKNKK